MASTTVVVGSAIGLHARPAAIIAEAAGKYDEEILIEFDGEEADAASALMIMALGAENGAEVTVTSDNADALTEIVALVAQDLDA
ncbi:MAG: HPr family phosphocarrier protein [Nocardiaceae bacterium]|nr:HPr family phosphocarrier protein [Nocardiaceae bacterium]